MACTSSEVAQATGIGDWTGDVSGMSVGYSLRRDRQSLLVQSRGTGSAVMARTSSHFDVSYCSVLFITQRIFSLCETTVIFVGPGCHFIDTPFATRVLGPSLNCLSRQAHFRGVLPAVAKDR
jgi:hypothetical protein